MPLGEAKSVKFSPEEPHPPLRPFFHKFVFPLERKMLASILFEFKRKSIFLLCKIVLHAKCHCGCSIDFGVIVLDSSFVNMRMLKRSSSLPLICRQIRVKACSVLTCKRGVQLAKPELVHSFQATISKRRKLNTVGRSFLRSSWSKIIKITTWIKSHYSASIQQR